MFSLDSALMRGLTRLADVMILNLLFLLTALPVVTLGAALTALNFTAMRIGSGDCNSVTGDYFRSFRQNFRQATVIGLLLAATTAALAAWYAVIPTLPFGGTVEFALLIVWYVLAFSLATTTVFVFPYLAQFDGSIRDVLRNARLLSWKHPLTAIAALLLIGLSLAVTVYSPVTTGYGMFWLFIGCAGIALANGFLFTRVFRPYIAAAAAAQD